MSALNGVIQGSVPVPRLPGFRFCGYYTGYAGSGEQIIDEHGEVCAELGTEEDLTLYACWTRTEWYFDFPEFSQLLWVIRGSFPG